MSQFRLPAGLTLAGQQAFDGEVQAYVTELAEQMGRHARRQRRPTSVYTIQDVREAKLAYEERLRIREDDEVVSIRGYALLMLLAAAALALLATYATGIVQATLLGLFVAVETAGLLLTRRCRRPGSDDG
jgi:hypothetical protein